MTARRVLRTDVWVDGVRYHAGTIPADEVTAQITHEKAWTQLEEPVQTPKPQPEEPVQTPKPQPVAQPSEATFDPTEHTVAEVHEYLGSADEVERQRVLGVERAGKARSGLIGS